MPVEAAASPARAHGGGKAQAPPGSIGAAPIAAKPAPQPVAAAQVAPQPQPVPVRRLDLDTMAPQTPQQWRLRHRDQHDSGPGPRAHR